MRPERREQAQRVRVRPQQVVEDEQDGRGRAQGRADGVEHEEAGQLGVAVGHGERLGPAEPAQELGPRPGGRGTALAGG
ncbi:hypothetical protein ACL02T_18930 [Pseudonocardia sp. RS010]|uniref:hypothetical protein n=1 Tax=Pseudonocardia sp. RS010 TaxID=3385979 RepID=UPI0039A30935